jgi:hypothetical protein
MQKFKDNKASSTIAKRTIVNFKKSGSISKGLTTNVNS